MKIDRTNYEEWLQDWLDNNLTASESVELRLFLEKNPDIRSEPEGIAQVKLIAGNESFQQKKKLKRDPVDISETQFELLCSAYMENDLTPDQKAEMDELTAGDREKLEILKSVSAMRLKAPVCSFPDKKLLIRKDPVIGIYRIVFATLSAAACLALVLLTGILSPDNPAPVEVIANETTPADIQRDEPVQQIAHISDVKKPSEALPENKSNITSSQERETVSYENTSFSDGREPVIIERAEINQIKLLTEAIPSALLVSGKTENRETEDYDYRSNTEKFITRVFRKDVMKEELPADSPLKAYEIAEAGVKGMNKLLGWDMALSRNTDENGEVKSVYFSSRIISFRAPVKKNENGE